MQRSVTRRGEAKETYHTGLRAPRTFRSCSSFTPGTGGGGGGKVVERGQREETKDENIKARSVSPTAPGVDAHDMARLDGLRRAKKGIREHSAA